MPTRKLPPDHEVAAMYDRGFSYVVLAEMYGVTNTAIGKAVRRAGHTPRSEYSGLMPADLHPDHYFAPAAKRLRALARRQGGASGRPLTAIEARALDNWLDTLRIENLVVAYDPDQPPNPASPTYGGWHYVPRPDGLPADRITAYEPA